MLSNMAYTLNFMFNKSTIYILYFKKIINIRLKSERSRFYLVILYIIYTSNFKKILNIYIKRNKNILDNF